MISSFVLGIITISTIIMVGITIYNFIILKKTKENFEKQEKEREDFIKNAFSKRLESMNFEIEEKIVKILKKYIKSKK
jgi:hypothetical protein